MLLFIARQKVTVKLRIYKLASLKLYVFTADANSFRKFKQHYSILSITNVPRSMSIQDFLDQPDATFYHITSQDNWDAIQSDGEIKGDRIFVSRVGELPILLSILEEQLHDILDSKGVVFLKFPQAKNNFLATEIRPDNQANEWAKTFQCVILRDSIPIDNIELMMNFNLNIERESKKRFLSEIANACHEIYKNHYINFPLEYND